MLNESPACRCSAERREEGVRHNLYLGETKLESTVQSCSVSSLHHYVLSVHPNPSDQLMKRNEIHFETDGSPAFHFDGFSLLSHRPLPPILPSEPQHKWTDEYRFVLEEYEKLSEQSVGSIRALDSLFSYITEDILELFDLRRWPEEVESKRRSRIARGLRVSREEGEMADGCPLFHVVPRFVRRRKDGSFELAPVSAVLEHITESYSRPFCSEEMSKKILDERSEVARALLRSFEETEKEGLVIDATRRPSSLRVDCIFRSRYLEGDDGLPVITHRTWRSTPFILAERADYQKIAAELAEKKTLLLKVTEQEERRGERGEGREDGELDEESISPQKQKQLRSAIEGLEARLQKMWNSEYKNQNREVPISLSSKYFRRTGFKADLAQHTILLIMMMNHVRFHWAIEKLEERISYKFEDRTLIELALSHPSYNVNYGTNPDHARNAINLCGVRKMEQKYREHLESSSMQEKIGLRKGRKRNKRLRLDRLVELADAMPEAKELQMTPGTVQSRLEFIGASVVDMIVSVHLFFVLPHADEGLFYAFRTALIQNQNQAALAKEILLDKFMLLSHGVYLSHEPVYRRAAADTFQAVIAAVYLDSGRNIDHCERIYGDAMYGRDAEALSIWNNLKVHELQSEYPDTDRHLIQKSEILQKLVVFEDSIGLKFAHISLLARAFKSGGEWDNMTKGENQTLRGLGATILSMSITEFLYKRFPLLHAGHLTLLSSCLSCNKTLSVIFDDLEMAKYEIDLSRHKKRDTKVKDKADFVHALLGAIYVDRGWEYCRAFTRACVLPRMKFFIDSQAWLDPKTRLQQLCHALPRPAYFDPNVKNAFAPEYRVVGETGPTNMREYTIACQFRGKRISEGVGMTRRDAAVKAAIEGMKNLPKFFPEEWAKYEQKVLNRREHIKRGERTEVRRGEILDSTASLPLGPSSTKPLPLPSLSLSSGSPPNSSLPSTGAKPMNLMSLDLQPLPSLLQPLQHMQQLSAGVAAAPPSCPLLPTSLRAPTARPPSEWMSRGYHPYQRSAVPSGSHSRPAPYNPAHAPYSGQYPRPLVNPNAPPPFQIPNQARNQPRKPMSLANTSFNPFKF